MSYSQDLYQYLNQVERALQIKNGYELSELMSMKDSHVQNPRLQHDNAESLCQNLLESPFDEMSAAHIRCAGAVANGNIEEACACQMIVVQSFLKGFQTQKEENWGLPVLFTVVLDLRLLALQVESLHVTVRKKKDSETLERAADTIMSCFRVCVSDNRTSLDNSKRWGTLAIVNQLFKIYFKLNKLPLCKPLIRAIDSSDIKDDFSISHLVTYRYFVGRKAMFDGEYQTAADCLTFSFEHCHISSYKNKRLILTYLIPVKMLLGQMPKQELLMKYKLTAFSDVASSVCTGNLMMFSQSMERHQAFFIKAGIYLILEKLKTVAMRNLFKRVWLLCRTHQLDLKAFEDALLFNQEEDIDSDEVECITANLIDKGYIKGYISHQHQKLVVSKQLVFPSLSSVQK